ncbi:hypothetical protein BS329_15570 [Amycolatopsis coloradensis]|uniref:DUF2637 domain-containing protein n=1 Tax=Amycolatopsis coloradensis TaxID=76021 RepID=A0A1R0KU75_9PSEU|nr:hypothetical protein BS329_15570 [Amycolatopsis coloradensis]
MIVVGFVGQIVGFGKLFGGTLAAYLVALIIGGAFELVMVSFGDKALAMRVEGYKTRQWIPFLIASAISAITAAAINLHHWSSVDITAAAIIGGTAFFGYIGHIFSGFVAGTKYKRERGARDKVLLEIADEQRREADALRKQEEKRIRETTQAADPGPARQSSPPPVTVTATARQPARDKPRTKRQQSTSGNEPSEERRLKKEVALPWMLAQPERPGPAEVNRHFEKQGYAPVNSSTIRRWWPEHGPRPEVTRDAGSAST